MKALQVNEVEVKALQYGWNWWASPLPHYGQDNNPPTTLLMLDDDVLIPLKTTQTKDDTRMKQVPNFDSTIHEY